MTSPWSEVDDWQQRQLRIFAEESCLLMRVGWSLMPSDDGMLWARRLRETDLPGLPLGGVPEIRAASFEVLLAELKLRIGRGVARA